MLDRLAASLAPRLGLAQAQLWPPSSQSAPVLLSTWIVVASLIYAVFIREGRNEALEMVKRRKKEMKRDVLRNVVWFEDQRLASNQAKAEANATKATKTSAPAEPDPRNSMMRVMSNAEKELKRVLSTDQQASIDAVEVDTEPPSAEKVFGVIFDAVTELPITEAIGVLPTDPYYVRASALFKACVRRELKEATEKTEEAQRIFSEGTKGTLSALDVEKAKALDYLDGSKLQAVVEFTKEKAKKHFGKGKAQAATATDAEGKAETDVGVAAFDAEYLAAAEAAVQGVVSEAELAKAEEVLAAVQRKQKKALSYIFDLVRPVLPLYLGAIFMDLLARACEAPLFATALPAFKASVARFNPEALEGQQGYGPIVLEEAAHHATVFLVVLFFFCPIEIIGNNLARAARRGFDMPLRAAVMRAIFFQDTEFFDRNNSGVLRERLNRDCAELGEKMLGKPKQLIMHIFRVIQRCLTLWVVAPEMLYACLVFNVPLFSVIFLLTQTPLERLWGRRDRARAVRVADTTELLQNIKTVRQFSMETREGEKYNTSNITGNAFEMSINLLEDLMWNIRGVMHHVGETYVIYTALRMAVAGEIDAADALVASTVGMWLQHDLKDVMRVLPETLKLMKPLRRCAALLSSRPRIEHDPANVDERAKLLRPARFGGNIEFRDVRFSYPTERQKEILKGLSFTADSGQKVAFVGQAGCGKSTSLDLLQRFYNRSSGAIFIDGRPIEDYDVNHLRKHCGVVAQKNTLFSRSIYENIVYGMDEEAIKAKDVGPDSLNFERVCRRACCWEFIQSFPDKQHTFVGEKGVKLSGGQQQRIAIARVIIREPTFLFLDEATSALDAINEKAVQAALDDMLREFSGVAIVVAHRLTTICNCDKIVVMGSPSTKYMGVKVEEGTHEELMQIPYEVDGDGNPVCGPGMYHALWDTQQGKKSGQEKEQGADKLREELAQLRADNAMLKAQLESAKRKRSASFGGDALEAATASSAAGADDYESRPPLSGFGYGASAMFRTRTM